MSAGGLRVLSGREASIFACVTDTVVAPVAPLPPVARTDAVTAFDASLAAAPALHRVALRGLLLGLELAPLALGFGHRLRRLDPARRARAFARLDGGRAAPVLKALRGLAHLSYYGDLGVMRGLGYDPEAVVARGRAVRAAEGRW